METLRSLDTSQLIGGVQTEDEFRHLFDYYYIPLCLYSFKILDSYEEAEDVVQCLFVKLWEEHRFDNFKGLVRPYLFSAVRNNSLKRLSKNKRIRFEDISDYQQILVEDGDCESNKEELEKKLMKELDGLAPQSRKVFESIVFQNMKYKEVASMLGISVNTVKTLFTRSLRQIRQSIPTLIIILLR